MNNHFPMGDMGELSNVLQNTSDIIAISLIKILRLGPLVSFNGSPTVSPTTADLWIYDPFVTTLP